jgi:hypothetical protein
MPSQRNARKMQGGHEREYDNRGSSEGFHGHVLSLSGTN